MILIYAELRSLYRDAAPIRKLKMSSGVKVQITFFKFAFVIKKFSISKICNFGGEMSANGCTFHSVHISGKSLLVWLIMKIDGEY